MRVHNVHIVRRLMCGMGKSEFSSFINLRVFVWVELKL